MVEQGFDFYLSDDNVNFEKIEEQIFKINFRYQDPFFFNSELLYTDFFINNILFNKDNEPLSKMNHPPIDISNKLENNNIEITIYNLSFDLESTDHIKIMWGFNTDRREGQINLLL